MPFQRGNPGRPRTSPEPLTAHQLDTLRLYAQLGTYEGVADFRGVNVSAVDATLRLIRVKLGVATTAEALAAIDQPRPVRSGPVGTPASASPR